MSPPTVSTSFDGKRLYYSHKPPIPIPKDVDIFSLVFALSSSHPDRPAITDAVSRVSYTYGELLKRTLCIASGLYRKLAFGKGKTLAVFSPNNVDYLPLLLGALYLGGTVTTANPNYTVDELAYQLKDSGATWIFTIPSFLSVAEQAARVVGIPTTSIFVLGDTPFNDKKCLKQLFSWLDPPKIEYTEDILEGPALLCYSSGTTGRSKGVILTHRNVVANAYQMVHFEYRNVYQEGDTWTGVLPFYHIYALTVVGIMGLYLGVHIVLLEKFDFLTYLDMLQKYRVTCSHIVPPIILQLAKNPIVDKYDLSSLRMIMSGAAPLGVELHQEVANRLKGCDIKQGYGMTEASPVTHLDPGVPASRPGSAGMLVVNMEARIVDPETGKDVEGFNIPGELWVRGPNVMKGYLNNVAATKSTLDDEGFLHTGDIAYVDKDGYYFIVDRLKELIKVKGLQVPPAELEALLLSHNKVSDAAVIPVPDEAAGELPKAYVVPMDGKVLSSAGLQTELRNELQKFVEGRVARHKWLKGGIEFVKEIPKTPSGKILRRTLRDMNNASTSGAAKAKL